MGQESVARETRGLEVADRGEMRELLTQSRKMVVLAMDECRTQRASPEEIVHLKPGAGWEHELQQLLGRTRHEAVLVVSNPVHPQPNYSSSRSLVTGLLTAGRQVRLLYSQRYAQTRDPARLLEHSRIHERTRVVDGDLCNMIIIDRRIALIWGRAGEQRPQGLVIRDPGVLRVIHPLTSVLWTSATNLSPSSAAGAPELDDTARAVLRALAEGLKDETAARRLSVSLRTYRRHVADLMVRLGATTRFQVGARAAELGLLEPRR